ncbi:MAG: DUF1801 domain-containing protein [Candidatus Thermoplasmatota archaeon]|nr:DUF1801 domain-containing protein [Candidatus Thermoplasmatota archaeon]MCL5988610.1 DUF1801 domain-containing protein [Candidatus Thermoplasmatota archaeon]
MKPDNGNSTGFLSPSREIDNIIKASDDWRGRRLSELRAIILKTDLEIIEEVKWKKPSRPEGVPVWSHNGIVCVADILKNAVRLTFPQGAKVQDPGGIFNTRLDSRTVRAIDFNESDAIDGSALASVILGAIEINSAKSKNKNK